MRTIKFRGKRLGKWEYGDLMHDNIGGVYIFPIDAPGLYRDYMVNTNTVGQFTGFTDKNGKEIYEGDIIYSEFSDGSHTKCLVGWNEDEACFGIMDESKLEGYDFPKFDCGTLHNFRNHGTRFEVIGNIYENSELLNKD